MTTILQRFRRLARLNRERALLIEATRRRLSAGQLEDLIARIDALDSGHEPSFALAFARANLHERVAETRPREERAPWLVSAVRSYEAALRAAESGHADGVEWIEEAAPDRWAPGLDADERAIRATCFRLGVLLCVDFRVRDPARAISYLRRVIGEQSSKRGLDEAARPDPEAAASGSGRAASSKPRYHPAWYYLGEAYLLAGDFDVAERAWREGLARSPGDAALEAVLRNLPADRVRHRVKARDWPGVLDELRRLPPEAMPRAERLALEGDAFHELGDLVRAANLYCAAIDADPHVVDVRRKLRKLDPRLPDSV